MLISSGDSPGQPTIHYHPHLSLDERRQRYGRGHCEPSTPIYAGDYTTLTFTFDIGADGLATGGRLGIVWLWPLDWADLQTDRPTVDGYLSLVTPPEVTLAARYHRLWGVDRWNHLLELEVTDGALAPGDRVTVTCGDRSAGSRGWRAPTCAVSASRFLMLLNPDGGRQWLALPDPPTYTVLAGPAERLVIVAPSEGIVGETQRVIVHAIDRWGNPSPLASPDPALTALSYPTSSAMPDVFQVGAVERAAQGAVHHVPVIWTQAGHYRLTATVPALPFTAISDPIRVHATPPAQRVFWGDLHSGQSEIGCGAGTLAEHYAYGRDVAGLDFTSHQGNDHHVTLADWRHTRAETQAFNAPGEYVVFLGCEFSPPTRDGGDRNVIYRYDEARLRRSGRYFTDTEHDPEPDLPTATEFHAVFGVEAVLVNMHVGGRPTNLDYHLPAIEPLAEIQSTHGLSEWFILDALQRGYQVGITAGTDGVMGRPGACYPGARIVRNIRNGLTAVYAPALTADALWDAFHARHCYATSGPRIGLHVTADGHLMGDAYTTPVAPTIHITVDGTAPLERVDLLRGTSVIHLWPIASPIPTPWADGQAGPGQVRLLWGGTQARGSAQAQRVIWDGQLELAGGRILAATPIDFQSPLDGVTLTSPTSLFWRSATAGNIVGLLLDVEGGADTECQFKAGPCAFSFRLGEVATPQRIEAGGEGCHVSVGPALRDDGPEQVRLTYDGPSMALPHTPGVTYPYWVRVVQVDQARAWSSPVYVSTQS